MRFSSFLFLITFFITVAFAREYQNNEILFCLKQDRAPLQIQHSKYGVQTDRPAINTLLKKYGAVRIEKWLPMADERDVVDGVELSKIYRVVFSSPKNHEALMSILQQFRQVKDVQSAAREAINHIDANFEPYIPNDPYFSKQWYLNKIMAPETWGLWGGVTPGDSTVLVGVVDTGIDYTHPDLAEAMWVNLGEDANGDGKITAEDENGVDDDGNGYVDDFMGWDFANQDNDVMPPDPGPHYELSHGTHVSGVIAAVADNGIGIAGISFRSKLIVTKHAADNDLTNPNIVKGYSGVLYCAKMGAKIINCSWGGGYDLYGKLVVENVTKNYGAIVVAAAGNDSHSNDENPSYPSDYDNTISVAALNNADKKAYYSNWGKVVDISAPGGEGSSYYNAILSTIHVSAGSYISWQGTSMATPVVAGALALLKAWFPNDTRGQLLSRLLNNADPIDTQNPGYKGLLGAGRVNVYNAIAKGIFPKISLRQYAWFNSDSTSPMPGDSVRLYVSIENETGWKDASGVVLHLHSNSPYIQILDSLIMIDSLKNGQTADSLTPLPYVFIKKDAPFREIDLQLVVTANDTSVYPYQTSFDLKIQPMAYQAGFPVDGYGFSSALSFVRLSSGENVIVGVTNNGQLLVFNQDGSIRSGFPVDVGSIKSAPAVGDVNHDGKKDIVIVNRDGTVWVIDFTGSVLFKEAFKESVYGDVALVNMDDDPQLEIIFGTMRKNLHVLKIDSSEIAGFPKAMPSLINVGTALADFNGDQLPDMVVGTFDGNLHVITNQGDSLTHFPVKLSARLSATPVVVRNNGHLFMIAPTNDHKLLKISEQGQIEFEKTFNIKFDEQLINLYRLLETANYSKDNEIRRKANKLRHKIVNITRLIANGGSSVGISENITNVFRNIYDYRNLKLTKKNKENIEKIKIIPKEVRQKIENGIYLTNELENWFTKDVTNLFETETIEAEEKKIYLFVDISSSMTPEQIKWAILTVKAFKKAIDLDNFELYKFNTRVFKWNKKGNVEKFFEKIGGGTSYSEVERKINKLNDSDEKLFIILTDMHFYPYELERIDKMISYNQNIIFLLIRKKLALDNIARIYVPRLKKYFKKYLSPTFDAYVKNLNEILNIYLRT